MTDYRDSPAYTISEVAHYLAVPPATVRYWATGQGDHQPLISIPAIESRPTLLSFFNLVELHVLSSIRRKHVIPLPRVRVAIDNLVEIAHEVSHKSHPLISNELQTDGIDLFVEQSNVMVNLNKERQQEMRSLIEAVFKRISRDYDGAPIRLFPFTRATIDLHAPETVVIDPNLSGGRPVIAGTGIATQVIAERHKAGESVSDLAYDYGRTTEEIEEALRCESAA